LSCVESAQAEPFRYDSITMAGLGGLAEACEPQPHSSCQTPAEAGDGLESAD
jgi:hypothetical protein